MVLKVGILHHVRRKDGSICVSMTLLQNHMQHLKRYGLLSTEIVCLLSRMLYGTVEMKTLMDGIKTSQNFTTHTKIKMKLIPVVMLILFILWLTAALALQSKKPCTEKELSERICLLYIHE